MISQRTSIIVGLLLILAALTVTGSSFQETGMLSSGVAIAAGICVVAGLAIIVTSGYWKKK